jgi:parvulin-like peptidyl-prolyl isomerase
MEVSDEEVRAAYEANAARYTRPAQRRLAVLVLKKTQRMSKEKVASLRARMAEAREAAVAMAPGEQGFGKLAIRYSEDQATRYRGGDTGWTAEGKSRWHPEAVEAGFALEAPGQVSDVIETADGFYLVKFMEARPSTMLELDKIAPSIRQELLKVKRREERTAFVSSVKAATDIEIFEDALERNAERLAGVAEAEGPEPPALP